MTITEIVQIVTAAGTIILASFTLAYVLLTREIVREMKTTRETQLRPYIIIDLEFYRTNLCHMIIKNIGNGAAFDVQIDIRPDVIYREPDIKLSDLQLFQQLKFFPAGKEIKFFLTDMRAESEIKTQKYFYADIKYRDSAMKDYGDTLSLDLTWHKKLMFLEDKDFNDVVKTLEQINQSYGDIHNQLNRLTVALENKEH